MRISFSDTLTPFQWQNLQESTLGDKHSYGTICLGRGTYWYQNTCSLHCLLLLLHFLSYIFSSHHVPKIVLNLWNYSNIVEGAGGGTTGVSQIKPLTTLIVTYNSSKLHLLLLMIYCRFYEISMSCNIRVTLIKQWHLYWLPIKRTVSLSTAS